MAQAKQTQTRDEIAREISEQLLASLNRNKGGGDSLTDRVVRWGADKISDAGNGFAEISAGFTAAADNFAVARESALLRQKQRTAEKVAALVERQLQVRGL